MDDNERAAMTPRQVAAARRKLRLGHWHFATMLGYVGGCRRDMTYFLESGRRPLREPQRRLLEAYLLGYRPPDWNEADDVAAADEGRARR